jgi:phosphate transport system substrate-binding protein
VKRLMRPLPVLALALAACGGGDRAPGDSTAATSSGSSDLTGAGATFPYPLYSKWFSDYARETGVRINYQSIGSGGGIRQISEQTVDFGASDAPMTDQELSAAKGGRLLHFPSILGAVVVTYNVPGVTQPLKLTGEMIARIYRGEVTKWDHAELAALNPGITLPNRDILPAYRSDGSGTTFVFTDYLATVSPAWSQKPGRGKQVEFPAGLGGKGNEGVAGLVKQTPGAIGYVELAYARQNNLPAAQVRNRAGSFVAPSAPTITRAAAGAVESLQGTTDYRVSIVDAPGADAYPIATFTWLLVYETQPDADKGRKLADFLRWAYDAGQRSADALGYAPLPASLTARLTQRVDSLRIGATR